MAKYPGAIPTLDEIFKAIDDQDWTNASEWNDLRAELRAALVELGTHPAGTFDTVKDRLNDIYPQFHDRGDVANYDLTEAGMTMDGAWHDWDLSAIVPVGAKAVLLRTDMKDASIGVALYFRENGNVNVRNVGIIATQVANIRAANTDLIIPCSAARVIEYNTSPGVDSINIVVKGWWK